MAIRLVLADDHVLFSQALKRVLEPHFEVLEMVGDGKALQVAARKHKPDVIVTDITMPLMSGLDSMKSLRNDVFVPKIIFLTMHGDSELARECLSIGGAGFVTKESSFDELTVAINAVMSNHNYISPKVAAELLAPATETSSETPHFEPLSARQREILQLLAEGRTMKEIARATELSTRTIEWHKYKMMKLLKVRRSSQLIPHAVRMKLVL